MNERQRNATNAQILGNLNDSNCDGNCTTRHFRSGTYEISGRLIFVGRSVHVNTHAHTVQGEGGGWAWCLIWTDGWLLWRG